MKPSKTPAKLFSLDQAFHVYKMGIQLGRIIEQDLNTSKVTLATKEDVQKTEINIMAKVSSLAGQLQAIAAQAEKGKAEVVAAVATAQAKIEELTAALADADLTAEQQSALDAVAAAVQGIDDLNPDAAPPTA